MKKYIMVAALLCCLKTDAMLNQKITMPTALALRMFKKNRADELKLWLEQTRYMSFVGTSHADILSGLCWHAMNQKQINEATVAVHNYCRKYFSELTGTEQEKLNNSVHMHILAFIRKDLVSVDSIKESMNKMDISN